MTDSDQKLARADARNRLSLGGAVKEGHWYSITIEEDGVIVLTPVVMVAATRRPVRAA